MLSRTLNTSTPFVTEYGYLEGAQNGTTTTLVKTVKNGNNTLEYAYDELGNITSVKKNNVIIEQYGYDSLNQLTSATYGGDTYTYTYDNGGNILSVNKNGMVFKGYSYDDLNWTDKLTYFNGDSITYDEIGNPINYRDGYTFMWMNGRNLYGVYKDDDYYAYSYDSSGLRTSKNINGTETRYYWLNGILQAQKTGDEYIIFLYDENGSAYGMIVNNGTTEAYYYYVFNLQGDVIGIVDSNGQTVVEYTYGAWGDILSITGSMADTIGQKNPLRYRGYYYDNETGFYYLQSRYYDPVLQRFLNADMTMGVNTDTTTYNLYVYCGNSPIIRYDNNGAFWKYIINGVLHGTNTIAIAIGIDTAAIGAVFLDMQKDDKGIYHADFDCWQQKCGYNDFYDSVFDVATSMYLAKFPFFCSGTQYMIWAWKGDYINLGAGAELGIYYDGGSCWLVDTSLAMSMCMGLMYEGTNIIWYAPSEKQWWITGFNPEFQNKKASQLTAVFGINFNSQTMYDAFYGAYKKDSRIYAFIPSEYGVVIRF